VTRVNTLILCEGDSVKREKRANKDHLFKGILGIDPGHLRDEVNQPERVQRAGLINLPQAEKRIKNSPQGLPPNNLEERKNESLTVPLRRDILGYMSKFCPMSMQQNNKYRHS
jgi:hypothetical protein